MGECQPALPADTLALPAVTLADFDVKRLSSLLLTRVGLAYRSEAGELRNKLRRATVVGSHAVRADLVTMNSKVLYADLASRETKEITIVYPWSAGARSTTTVLSPVGTALLGLRIGDTVALGLESGAERTLRVLAIPSQPEAAGDWHL